MWIGVFVVSLVVCGLTSAAYIDVYEGAFNKFISEYNKNYDKETYGKRYKIFRENLEYIEDFNAKNTQMQLGINDMTDLTHDEYLTLLQPSRQPLDTTSEEKVLGPSLPVSVDWRNKSDVAAVADMRPCNGPIYSVVGSVQSFCSIAAGTMTSYDPKQVVQCAPGGCNATEDEIFGYIGHNGLHNTWGNCNVSANYQGCCISDHICFGGMETTLAVSVALMGPTVVSIDASQPSFKSYKNGLYVEPACNTTNLNFNLLVIGYGTTPQGDEYWIAQNNWGTTWGQAGYIYMPRNQNSCGIAGHQCHPLGVHACVRSKH